MSSGDRIKLLESPRIGSRVLVNDKFIGVITKIEGVTITYKRLSFWGKIRYWFKRLYQFWRE